MRSAPSAEPVGRRGFVHTPASNRSAPRCGRGRPRSQGGVQPIPCLEMRSSSSAERAGRRGFVYTPASNRSAPRCGRGRPRSQGGLSQSHGWRCARPRARSAQGDGGPCMRQTPQIGPPQDAGGDARAPRGASANPTVGDALVLGRGARRATGGRACVKPRRSVRPKMRAGTPALPGGRPANPTRGEALVLERGARRATGGHVYTSLRTTSSGCRRGRPRSQGNAPPIPWLERRPASGAEPAGRRGAVHASNPADRRAPRCGRGRPRSQGGATAGALPEDAELGLGAPRGAVQTQQLRPKGLGW
jgi:hypothetical protein